MLYIRADRNKVIATGHVMRCLAIADAVRKCGEEVVFLLADEEAVELLSGRGYRSIVLGTAWDDMESELPRLLPLLKEKPGNLLIDSYQVTPRYLRELSAVTDTTYIDDLDRFVYPVHKLVCYEGYWRTFRYEERYANTATALYLGVAYTPLREEFSGCKPKKIRPVIQNLLLLSGGTDPADALRKILRKISPKHYARIDVICGAYYAFFKEFSEEFSGQENVHIQKSVMDIKRYYDAADVVISAGGSTLYELCACGTPAISFAIADNQLENVRQFAADSLIACAGDARKDDITENIAAWLTRYTYEVRCERSRRMQEYIDGQGAGRIAKILFN